MAPTTNVPENALLPAPSVNPRVPNPPPAPGNHVLYLPAGSASSKFYRAEVVDIRPNGKVDLEYENDDGEVIVRTRVPYASPSDPGTWCWGMAILPDPMPLPFDAVTYVEPHGKRVHSATVSAVYPDGSVDLFFHDNWGRNDVVRRGVHFNAPAPMGSWRYLPEMTEAEQAEFDEKRAVAEAAYDALPEAQRPAIPLDSEGRRLDGLGVPGYSSTPTIEEQDVTRRLAAERQARGTNPPTPTEIELMRLLEDLRARRSQHPDSDRRSPNVFPEGRRHDSRGRAVDARGRQVTGPTQPVRTDAQALASERTAGDTRTQAEVDAQFRADHDVRAARPTSPPMSDAAFRAAHEERVRRDLEE